MCTHNQQHAHAHMYHIHSIHTHTHAHALWALYWGIRMLVCGVHLRGVLFSCFQALHSFWIQNLALECGPGEGMTRLPQEWNQRNSAACFLIPGTGQAFLPSAKGLCFCETKPERAVSWSELNPRPPQILLLGCLSQSLMVLGNPLPFPVLAASSGGTQGKGSL